MLSEQQQRIMGYFIEEAKDHLNTIEQGLVNLQSTIEDPEMVSEVFRAAHSVKGGAAMLGLSSIQRTAHRLEDYFKVLKECSQVRVDQKSETLFLRIFDTLQELVEQLQGPFGLTEDKAAEAMAAVEPVFNELNQHLNFLVNQAGGTPPEDVQLDETAVPVAVAATPAPPQPAVAEESALRFIFQNDVPARLREMLQLFKQGESAETRSRLQEICRTLAQPGEQFEMPQWCDLLEVAQRAIGCPENAYRTLAPIIIKDVKRAQELVLGGQTTSICACEDLLQLLPVEPVLVEPEVAIDTALTDLDLFTEMAEPAFGGESLVTEPALDAAASDAAEFDFSDFGTPAFAAAETDQPLGEQPDAADFLFAEEFTEETGAADAEDWFSDGFNAESGIAEDDLGITLIEENDLAELGGELDFDLNFGAVSSDLGSEGSDLPDFSLIDSLDGTNAANVTEQSGPEVGAAELNSLADLFEGELPELGLTWQEERIIDPVSAPFGVEADATGDFSDLLLEQDGTEDLFFDDSEDEDLSGLLDAAALQASRPAEPAAVEPSTPSANPSSLDEAWDNLDLSFEAAFEATEDPSNGLEATNSEDVDLFFLEQPDDLGDVAVVEPSSDQSFNDLQNLDALFAEVEIDELVLEPTTDIPESSTAKANVGNFAAMDGQSRGGATHSIASDPSETAMGDLDALFADVTAEESFVFDSPEASLDSSELEFASFMAESSVDIAANSPDSFLSELDFSLDGHTSEQAIEPHVPDPVAPEPEPDDFSNLWDAELPATSSGGASGVPVSPSNELDLWDDEANVEPLATDSGTDADNLFDFELETGLETAAEMAEPEPNHLAGLDSAGLDLAELDLTGLDSAELNSAELDLAELDILSDASSDSSDDSTDPTSTEPAIDLDSLFTEPGMAELEANADLETSLDLEADFADFAGLTDDLSDPDTTGTIDFSFGGEEAFGMDEEADTPASLTAAAEFEVDDLDGLNSLSFAETTATAPESSLPDFETILSAEAELDNLFQADDSEPVTALSLEEDDLENEFDFPLEATEEVSADLDDNSSGMIAADLDGDSSTELFFELEEVPLPETATPFSNAEDEAGFDLFPLDSSHLFDDLEAGIADSAAEVGLAEAIELPSENQDGLSDADFGDLEAMLGETEDVSLTLSGEDGVAPSSPTDELDEFADLEAMLATEAPATEAIPSSIDEFADLEALLGDSPAAPAVPVPAAPAVPVVSVPAAPARSLLGEDEFGDLEALLQDADQKLGVGSSPVRNSGGTTARRPTRRNVIADQTMRVSVKHLDNLNNLVGELVVNRNSLEQTQERLRQFLDNLLYQVQQLSDVGQRMRDLYERSLLESSLLSSRRSYQLTGSNYPQPQTNHATGMSFDALEMDRFTGFHTLSQEMIELIVRVRESASDIDFVVEESDQITRNFRQITTQLQEGLTRSRMVPFAQTADRLPRGIRDNAIKYGKQAELGIEGRDTLIDKMIVEQLYDPMTHLVNNAIAHGIETPEERTAAGKSPTGRITIRAFHQGNQTVISVSDDGAGINPEKVKAKAVVKGLITAAEAQQMTRLDVYDLLFHHGFSTADQVDDLRGRGVGLDVVRNNLSEIRGVISIDSAVGKGTTFTIRLPLTLSISKALCCISNRARVAFPMDGVEDMLDVPQDRILTDEQGRSCIQWRDTLLPLHPLAELLKYNRVLGRGSVYGGNQEEDMLSVVVLRSAGNYLALQVDQVLGEQEIVIKQLEGPVPKPVGVAGATVLGDGRIMPIADVLELIDLSQGRIRREANNALWETGGEPITVEADFAKTEPTVLIVDDSITVRELLSMTFNKVGYRVEQARDGQEAWEKLRSGLPCDLVFCDIEMPRMDGLELLSRIQKDPHLSELPIAMLTSRGADRHRQMAVQLGAKGYFTKPYLEEVLLDAAQRMLKGEVLVTSNVGN